MARIRFQIFRSRVLASSPTGLIRKSTHHDVSSDDQMMRLHSFSALLLLAMLAALQSHKIITKEGKERKPS